MLTGETGMFEIVMRRHNQRLYRVARAILRNDGEAEDVMQDAYVRAYEHLGQFAGRAKFSTWLTRIAVHEALARQRHGNRYNEGLGSLCCRGEVRRVRSVLLNQEDRITGAIERRTSTAPSSLFLGLALGNGHFSNAKSLGEESLVLSRWSMGSPISHRYWNLQQNGYVYKEQLNSGDDLQEIIMETR